MIIFNSGTFGIPNAILNQTAAAQAASFWISGTGKIDTPPTTANGVMRLGDITFTPGSVPFAKALGLDQNNAALFWDNTLKVLGIGTNLPAQQGLQLGDPTINQQQTLQMSRSTSQFNFQHFISSGGGYAFRTVLKASPFTTASKWSIIEADGSLQLFGFQTGASQNASTLVAGNGGGFIGGTSQGQFSYAGATLGIARVASVGSSSITMGVGESYTGSIWGRSNTNLIIAPVSGINPAFAQMVLRSLGAIATGGATVTLSATLYIVDAATGAVNNYAIYSAAGWNRLVGRSSVDTAPVNPTDIVRLQDITSSAASTQQALAQTTDTILSFTTPNDSTTHFYRVNPWYIIANLPASNPANFTLQISVKFQIAGGPEFYTMATSLITDFSLPIAAYGFRALPNTAIDIRFLVTPIAGPIQFDCGMVLERLF